MNKRLFIILIAFTFMTCGLILHPHNLYAQVEHPNDEGSEQDQERGELGMDEQDRCEESTHLDLDSDEETRMINLFELDEFYAELLEYLNEERARLDQKDKDTSCDSGCTAEGTIKSASVYVDYSAGGSDGSCPAEIKSRAPVTTRESIEYERVSDCDQAISVCKSNLIQKITDADRTAEITLCNRSGCYHSKMLSNLQASCTKHDPASLSQFNWDVKCSVDVTHRCIDFPARQPGIPGQVNEFKIKVDIKKSSLFYKRCAEPEEDEVPN